MAECECIDFIRSLFNAIQAGIVLIDEETKVVVDINPAACFMFGVKRDSVVGKRCMDALYDSNCIGCPVLTNDFEDDKENREIIIHRKDGSKVYALLTIVSRILKDRRVFINTIVDITKQKEAEKELSLHLNKAAQLLDDNMVKLKNGDV